MAKSGPATSFPSRYEIAARFAHTNPVRGGLKLRHEVAQPALGRAPSYRPIHFSAIFHSEAELKSTPMKTQTLTTLFLFLSLAGPGFGCSSSDSPSGSGQELPELDRSPRVARFQLRNVFTLPIPPGSKKVRAWIPLPQHGESEYPTIKASTVRNLVIDAGGHPVTKQVDDQGNSIAYVELLNPHVSELVITQSFELERTEVLKKGIVPSETRPYTAQELAEKAAYLQPSSHVPINDRVIGLASTIVGDEKNPVLAARAIYDWMLENIDYWVKDPNNDSASALGDTDHCLNLGTGNCTDFHSAYTALARAAKIPTRMVYGGLLKEQLNGLDIDASYHCWAEYWAPKLGWIPLDVSVADLWYGDNLDFNQLTPEQKAGLEKTAGSNWKGQDLKIVDYYYGNMDERRVVWSIGRDIKLTPAPAGGPANVMVKGYYEIDDIAHEWSWDKSTIPRKFTYTALDAKIGPEWPLR